MKKTIQNYILTALVLVLLLTGCDLSRENAGTVQSTTVSAQTTEAVLSATQTDTEPEAVSESRTDETGEAVDADPVTKKLQRSGTSLADVPPYDGTPYIQLANNVPDFTDEDKQNTEAFENYSELDILGRCGQAYANICPELQPTEERGAIGSVRPSGWHTVKYNDLIDGNYLYNRCHLIAYCLAGENANEQNLITGTRYLNIEGMLPFENMVDAYVDKTGNHVLYRVTPIFEGNNLVASGVEMEGWSVEDQGAGICFHVYCYNVQPGIEIDYADGESRESQETTVEVTESSQETAEQTTEAAPETTAQETEAAPESAETYILNTNTKKIHRPSCSSVSQMKDVNKQTYEGTVEELERMGYTPCKRCNP